MKIDDIPLFVKIFYLAFIGFSIIAGIVAVVIDVRKVLKQEAIEDSNKPEKPK